MAWMRQLPTRLVLHDSVEYQQTPDTAEMGMDGDLVQAPNPDYDPLRKGKKGETLFLRHHGIGRNVIKAYDVQVQTVQLPKRNDLPALTVIRLTPDSKKRLAEIDPTYEYDEATAVALAAASDEAAQGKRPRGAAQARTRPRAANGRAKNGRQPPAESAPANTGEGGSSTHLTYVRANHMLQ